MANHKTGAQRYNDKMDKIWAKVRMTEPEWKDSKSKALENKVKEKASSKGKHGSDCCGDHSGHQHLGCCSESKK